MLIPPRAKIETACPDDPLREFIAHVVFEADGPEGPHLVATDGHMLAVVPVQLAEKDVPGPIPTEALERMRKKRSQMGHLNLDATHAENEDGARFPRPKSEKFPDWRTVIPPVDEDDHLIAVDVDLLHRAAEAIGTKHVVLRVKMNPQAAIMVRPGDLSNGARGAYAVVMPMRA